MNLNRINRVIENMRAEGLKQILVSAPASVYYLTGAWVEPGERMLALHIRENGDVRLYANRLFALSGTIDTPLTEYDDTEDCIALLADGIDSGTLGVDKIWHSQFTLRLMEARRDMHPVLGSRPVDKARMIKDAEEIELMWQSSQMNLKVCQDTADMLEENCTEKMAQSCYNQLSIEAHSSGPSFTPLICFGKNCAEPHHDSDNTPLKKGDSVILDVGLILNRYCSDMTRTIFFGGATDEQQRVYDIVAAANRAAIAACRPGVKMRDVDRAARKVIEEAGYGKYFIHRTGHSIGLEVHEKPDCSAADETVLQPGMVFSIEPGIYLPERFGVRIEDLVAIHEDGCHVLTEKL